ncbi:hypothetical protein B0H15DRAFT_506542 [Mycena belliarum]|uniref:Uncharacterized protein n=1 Tax=Mycena belliarum TaxID=1033014 RepID=A0AAD6UEM7_9AGAR|nr:hypothetical protein B0H15DRAFT_506542 [Mycena belliae]
MAATTPTRDLFQETNKIAASIGPEEKRWSSRVGTGIGGDFVCGTYSCFSESIRAGATPPFLQSAAHLPLRLPHYHWGSAALRRLCRIFTTLSHALGALTAVVGIAVSGDVAEPLGLDDAPESGFLPVAHRDWPGMDPDASFPRDHPELGFNPLSAFCCPSHIRIGRLWIPMTRPYAIDLP